MRCFWPQLNCTLGLNKPQSPPPPTPPCRMRPVPSCCCDIAKYTLGRDATCGSEVWTSAPTEPNGKATLHGRNGGMSGIMGEREHRLLGAPDSGAGFLPEPGRSDPLGSHSLCVVRGALGKGVEQCAGYGPPERGTCVSVEYLGVTFKRWPDDGLSNIHQIEKEQKDQTRAATEGDGCSTWGSGVQYLGSGVQYLGSGVQFLGLGVQDLCSGAQYQAQGYIPVLRGIVPGSGVQYQDQYQGLGMQYLVLRGAVPGLRGAIPGLGSLALRILVMFLLTSSFQLKLELQFRVFQCW
ncbi:hypothetical protein TREES_T100010483 [Tupaia chinensis]|uniref:Uncharacterized protein n=1 Tax=Tupaia chinensis TaxID=246437 RepID=L9LAG3_TUPCH|nr:hypothetical protein TREES_T100010483 [Tupaia chinensis]